MAFNGAFQWLRSAPGISAGTAADLSELAVNHPLAAPTSIASSNNNHNIAPPTNQLATGSLTALSGNSNTYYRFQRFIDLPKELQIKIWIHTTGGARVLRLRGLGADVYPSSSFKGPMLAIGNVYFDAHKVPAGLHVCHLSRQECLKVYKLSFPMQKFPIDYLSIHPQPSTPYTYFNFENDVVFIDMTLKDLRQNLEVLKRYFPEFEKVQNLALKACRLRELHRIVWDDHDPLLFPLVALLVPHTPRKKLFFDNLRNVMVVIKQQGRIGNYWDNYGQINWGMDGLQGEGHVLDVPDVVREWSFEDCDSLTPEQWQYLEDQAGGRSWNVLPVEAVLERECMPISIADRLIQG